MKVTERSHTLKDGQMVEQVIEYEIDCITEAEQIERDRAEKAAQDAKRAERANDRAKVAGFARNPPRSPTEQAEAWAAIARMLTEE